MEDPVGKNGDRRHPYPTLGLGGWVFKNCILKRSLAESDNCWWVLVKWQKLDILYGWPP